MAELKLLKRGYIGEYYSGIPGAKTVAHMGSLVTAFRTIPPTTGHLVPLTMNLPNPGIMDAPNLTLLYGGESHYKGRGVAMRGRRSGLGFSSLEV